jgi:hypothetical protein
VSDPLEQASPTPEHSEGREGCPPWTPEGNPRGRTAPRGGTVGRAAFLGGLLVGIGVAVLGFSLLPRFDLPYWASTGAEIAVMTCALFLTTRVWQMSAVLDTSLEQQDREETDA